MLIRERRTADEARLLEIAHEGEFDVVGQVALHPRSSAPVMALAATELGQPADRFGVVARLLVDPHRRRLGAGAELLERAAREAAALGLWPILDVVKDLTDAVALYERQGWQRIGEVTVTFDEDVTINELVYVAPPSLRPQ